MLTERHGSGESLGEVEPWTVGQIGLKPDAKVSVINAPASEEEAEEATGAEDDS